MSSEHDKKVEAEANVEGTWVKPAVTSFAPVKAAEGIAFRPTDGISNLTA